MAGLTQGNEIIRRIAAGASALQVMDIEHSVFGFAMAVLTDVTVPEKDIFTHVVKAGLLALLVFLTGNLRMLELLHVKGRRLYGNGGDGQDFQHFLNPRQMGVNAVLH